MELWRGQVAVVTGAASGIGLELAERFVSAGLSVVLADVEKGRLAAAEESVRSRAVEALSVETEVRWAESVEALATVAVVRFGGVDLVGAGVSTRGDPLVRPPLDMGVGDGRQLLGCCSWVWRVPARAPGARWGHIVSTASLAGLLPGVAGPAYDASKHAVVAITEPLLYGATTESCGTRRGGRDVQAGSICDLHPARGRLGLATLRRSRPSPRGLPRHPGDPPCRPAGAEVTGV